MCRYATVGDLKPDEIVKRVHAVLKRGYRPSEDTMRLVMHWLETSEREISLKDEQDAAAKRALEMYQPSVPKTDAEIVTEIRKLVSA